MKQPDLGNKILELRISMGLTQSELAEKCKLSLRTIQRIETAKVEPRSYTVKVIFSTLNYPIYDSFENKSIASNNMPYKQKVWFVRRCKKCLNLFDLKTNTVKKISYLSILLLLSLFLVVAFIIPIETTAQSKVFRTFYFLSKDSTLPFINNERIEFYKKQQKEGYPRIEFYSDSRFCYFHNVKVDTVTVVNKETGVYLSKVIEKSDKIYGRYLMLVEKVSRDSLSRITWLKIILKNEETIQYDVKEDDIILFLKRK